MAAGGVVALFSTVALAQGFPERPVRIIVPLTPGGSPDTSPRTRPGPGVWHQPVVVENRTGGSQNIGSDRGEKPARRLHLAARAGQRVLGQSALGKQPFDPLVDLMPVTQVARIQFLLVVPPTCRPSRWQELIALAKAKPGELNFGSSGNGSPQHLGATMFQLLTGTKMNHVPTRARRRRLPTCCRGASRWIGAANTLLPHIKEGSFACSATRRPSRKPSPATLDPVARPVPAGQRRRRTW